MSNSSKEISSHRADLGLSWPRGRGAAVFFAVQFTGRCLCALAIALLASMWVPSVGSASVSAQLSNTPIQVAPQREDGVRSYCLEQHARSSRCQTDDYPGFRNSGFSLIIPGTSHTLRSQFPLAVLCCASVVRTTRTATLPWCTALPDSRSAMIARPRQRLVSESAVRPVFVRSRALPSASTYTSRTPTRRWSK